MSNMLGICNLEVVSLLLGKRSFRNLVLFFSIGSMNNFAMFLQHFR